ncbi:Flap-structured DNA-binding and RNA-binding protein, partial [Tieghemiomyces parasiticus]
MGIPTTDGFVHYPSSSLNRLNSPVRSKFGFNAGPAASTHHHHHHHVHHQPHGTGYPYGHGGSGSGGAGPTHGSPNMGAAHLPGVYGMAKSRGPGSTTSLVSSTSAAVGAAGPVDPSDPSLLEDIPAWLRSLRLHKYTPCFENMHWKDVVDLTDEELTAKGVAALGARRKMLKVFETVRQGMEDKGLLPPKANGSRGGNQAKATAGEGEDDDNDDAEDGSGPDKEG